MTEPEALSTETLNFFAEVQEGRRRYLKKCLIFSEVFASLIIVASLMAFGLSPEPDTSFASIMEILIFVFAVIAFILLIFAETSLRHYERAVTMYAEVRSKR